jgi:four helix bundle protein
LFGLTQQLRKAAVSVVSNIAEGHGRQGPAETIRFLIIARGSLFEIESQIIVAGDLLYLNQEETANTCEAVGEIIRMLNGLIRRYESTRK